MYDLINILDSCEILVHSISGDNESKSFDSMELLTRALIHDIDMNFPQQLRFMKNAFISDKTDKFSL